MPAFAVIVQTPDTGITHICSQLILWADAMTSLTQEAELRKNLQQDGPKLPRQLCISRSSRRSIPGIPTEPLELGHRVPSATEFLESFWWFSAFLYLKKED